MKTVKMSLANIKSKLSRNEMKQIMAGSNDVKHTCTECYGYYISCSDHNAGGCVDKDFRCCDI